MQWLGSNVQPCRSTAQPALPSPALPCPPLHCIAFQAQTDLSRSALNRFNSWPKPAFPGIYVSVPSLTRPSSSLKAKCRNRPSSSPSAAGPAAYNHCVARVVQGDPPVEKNTAFRLREQEIVGLKGCATSFQGRFISSSIQWKGTPLIHGWKYSHGFRAS